MQLQRSLGLWCNLQSTLSQYSIGASLHYMLLWFGLLWRRKKTFNLPQKERKKGRKNRISYKAFSNIQLHSHLVLLTHVFKRAFQNFGQTEKNYFVEPPLLAHKRNYKTKLLLSIYMFAVYLLLLSKKWSKYATNCGAFLH